MQSIVQFARPYHPLRARSSDEIGVEYDDGNQGVENDDSGRQ